MNKTTFTFVVILSLLSQSFAQLAPDTYWIQFTDKNNNPYHLNEPEAYLSLRSIERRQRYNIEIDSLDLPVNAWYLDSIRAKGATVIHASKWMNGAAIYTTSLTTLSSIYNLDFVDQTASNRPAFSMNFGPANSESNLAEINIDAYDYGTGSNQIDLHQARILHNNGFQGQGMYIAVIDAGFQNVDTIHAFDSLFINHQIIGTWDFVTNDTNVYDDHYHGKAVLSTIAANLPGSFVGTAPKANFLLLRSEVAATEYKIEEINWIAAAEFADSVGVDLITTSLGYNDYSLPSNSYTWDDLDGATAPITLATDIASRKGILMVSSAGNEGSSVWKKITCPADAQLALTVGACDENGQYASFSSKGYSADGRVKPNVCAKGQATTVITGTEPTTGNGTSFSAPLMAGLAACLWQVNRQKTNLEIKDLIERHSHQYQNPDSLMGYGIPNFESAYTELITDIQNFDHHREQLISVFPTLFEHQIHLRFFAQISTKITVEIISNHGILMYKSDWDVDSNKTNFISIHNLPQLSSGVYFLRVISQEQISVQKIIKH